MEHNDLSSATIGTSSSNHPRSWTPAGQQQLWNWRQQKSGRGSLIIRPARTRSRGRDPSQCAGLETDLMRTWQRLESVQENIQKQYLHVTSMHFERWLKQQGFFFPSSSLIFPRRGLLKEPGTTLKADKGPPDGRDAVIRNLGG